MQRGNFFSFPCKWLFLLWTFLNAMTEARCDSETCAATSMFFWHPENLPRFAFSSWKCVHIRSLLKLLQKAILTSAIYIHIYMTLQLMTTYKKLIVILQFYSSLPAHPPAGIFLWGVSVYVFTTFFFLCIFITMS